MNAQHSATMADMQLRLEMHAAENSSLENKVVEMNAALLDMKKKEASSWKKQEALQGKSINQSINQVILSSSDRQRRSRDAAHEKPG
jgi:hypothetical protein